MFDFDDGRTAEADHGFDVDADEGAAERVNKNETRVEAIY
jgi:hypothetical protein